MRSFVGPCLVGIGLSVAAAACSGKSGGDDDAVAASGGTGGSGASGGTGGTGASGGSGATGGVSGSGASGGSSGHAGSGGGAGTAAQFITGGPFTFPQNKKPQYCTLTTVANASTTVQTIYNSWKSMYVTDGNPGLRVKRPDNGDNNDTVSEGIGYGMLAAVYMGDQATFDGLWLYAKAHLDMAGMMNWRINADGTTASQGSGSATDADEDIAWSLLMASGQWSSSDYYAAGKKMASAIMQNEVAGDGMLTPGDGWGSTNKTYPDYFSPAYFRVFKQVTGNANWDIVIKRNYEILANVSGQYGLVPDSTTSTYDLSQAYKYDACRAPWRIGMDYCFNGTAEAKAYLDKIGTFFDSQGVANIGDGYSLTGSKTSNYPNMAFIGPAGVAGMAGHQKLLDDAFTFGATGNGGTSGYFQQTLRVVTMLMMSGNFVDYTKP